MRKIGLFSICLLLSIFVFSSNSIASCSATAKGSVSSLGGSILDMDVVGSYAYIAVYGSNSLGWLKIVDVSDPDNPALVSGGSVSVPNATAVHVMGNYAYVMSYNGYSLYVVDISNPSSPTVKDSIETGDNRFDYGKDVYVRGGYAYVVNNDSGLHIVDISDPDNLSIVGSGYTVSNSKTILVNGNHAYVGAGGLFVLDISNPSSVTLADSVSGVGFVFEMELNWPYIFAANGDFQVFDITDPTDIQIGDYFQTSYVTTTKLALSDNKTVAFLRNANSSNTTVQVVDVSNPASVFALSCPYSIQYGYAIGSLGNNAFVTTTTGTFQSVNFDLLPIVLTTNVASSEGKIEGTVSGQQDLIIDCGNGETDCLEVLDVYDEVELTAIPDAGYSFEYFDDGVVCNYDNPATLELTTDTTVTAVFEEIVFDWPLSGSKEDWDIISDFEADWIESCGGLIMKHTGIDIETEENDPVYAAEDGIVKVAQVGTEFGGWVTLEHNESYTTVYWHITPSVSVNASVEKGDLLGTVVDYGSVVHLHFGVRNGIYTNTSNRGRLPQTACDGDPAFPENFIDPENFSFE